MIYTYVGGQNDDLPGQSIFQLAHQKSTRLGRIIKSISQNPSPNSLLANIPKLNLVIIYQPVSFQLNHV